MLEPKSEAALAGEITAPALNDIALAIRKLLEDESYAKRLGKQGKKRVEKEFTWDKNLKKLRDKLQTLI